MNIKFTINNIEICMDVDPAKTLLQLIREELNLKGTKRGCDMGECGSCTVIMNGSVVNSCLIPALVIDGANILTIEGITPEKGLTPLQEAMIETGAVQCGFCTPGIVVAGYDYLQNTKKISVDSIKDAISGNLCRCTGYKKIIEAFLKAADKMGIPT